VLDRAGPFRWEGKHYHFRHVNPWCLPLQKRTHRSGCRARPARDGVVAGRMGYTYVPFLVPIPIARELFGYYRQGAEAAGAR